MHSLLTWPRYILSLPTVSRIGLCIACFFLWIGLHFWIDETALLVLLPATMAAWCFRQRGTWSMFLAILSILAATNILHAGGLLWSTRAVCSMVTNGLLVLAGGGVFHMVRDYFTRKQHKKDLLVYNERHAKNYAEQLRQLQQLKEQFLLNINHELRTPLMALCGYLEYLQLLYQTGDTRFPSHISAIQHALQQCEELRTIVNNVLQTLEIGITTQPPACKRVCVLNLIRSIFASIDLFRREQHRIRISSSLNITVWSHEHCLRQILFQLLSNALKYSPPDTPIIIKAAAHGLEEERVCIRVQDMGPGIPLEDREILFDRFTRLQRDVGGTIRGIGAGLFICKHLVEAMGGEIWIESCGKAGQGCCFCFTLPLALPSFHIQERDIQPVDAHHLTSTTRFSGNLS